MEFLFGLFVGYYLFSQPSPISEASEEIVPKVPEISAADKLAEDIGAWYGRFKERWLIRC